MHHTCTKLPPTNLLTLQARHAVLAPVPTVGGVDLLQVVQRADHAKRRAVEILPTQLKRKQKAEAAPGDRVAPLRQRPTADGHHVLELLPHLGRQLVVDKLARRHRTRGGCGHPPIHVAGKQRGQGAQPVQQAQQGQHLPSLLPAQALEATGHLRLQQRLQARASVGRRGRRGGLLLQQRGVLLRVVRAVVQRVDALPDAPALVHPLLLHGLKDALAGVHRAAGHGKHQLGGLVRQTGGVVCGGLVAAPVLERERPCSSRPCVPAPPPLLLALLGVQAGVAHPRRVPLHGAMLVRGRVVLLLAVLLLKPPQHVLLVVLLLLLHFDHVAVVVHLAPAPVDDLFGSAAAGLLVALAALHGQLAHHVARHAAHAARAGGPRGGLLGGALTAAPGGPDCDDV